LTDSSTIIGISHFYKALYRQEKQYLNRPGWGAAKPSCLFQGKFGCLALIMAIAIVLAIFACIAASVALTIMFSIFKSFNDFGAMERGVFRRKGQ